MTRENPIERATENAYSMPTDISEETQGLLSEVSDLLAKELRIRLTPEYLMKHLNLRNSHNVDKLQKILSRGDGKKPKETPQEKAQKIFDMMFPDRRPFRYAGQPINIIRKRIEDVYKPRSME